MSDHHQPDAEKELFSAWDKYVLQEEFKEIRKKQERFLKFEMESNLLVKNREEEWLARAYGKK